MELEAIKRDKQIKKFCAYGLLKNMKFFEPYLIIFLMSHGLSLFQIGILITVREIVVNIFEIPSGLVADYFGRKKELCCCFLFYMISFVFFFFTFHFSTAVLAMVFFGLGEAFRSGTHKAMIYTYLDHMGWQKQKTFVYGRTRSYSLIGSAISSVLGIILVISLPKTGYLFLLSAIPYLLDFILILTYPAYLDVSVQSKKKSFSEMVCTFLNSLIKNRPLRKILLQEGMTEATLSYTKDMIQPILKMILLGSGVTLIAGMSKEDNLNLILGISYAVLNLVGSKASKNAYRVKKNKNNQFCMFVIQVLLAAMFGLLGIFTGNAYVVCAIYVIIYCIHNVRKPIYVDEIDNLIEKTNRATTLSVSSQLKSIVLMILAPLFGYISDSYGINVTMMIFCALFTLTLFVFTTQKTFAHENTTDN